MRVGDSTNTEGWTKDPNSCNSRKVLHFKERLTHPT